MEESELNELRTNIEHLSNRLNEYERMIIDLNDEVEKLHNINSYLREELTKALFESAGFDL